MTVKSLGSEWVTRTAVYEKDPHVKKQVSRLMEPYRLIHGTKDSGTEKEVLNVVARLMAALDVNPSVDRTANDSGIVVVRSPVGGNYDILLWASSVYDLHLARGSKS